LCTNFDCKDTKFYLKHGNHRSIGTCLLVFFRKNAIKSSFFLGNITKILYFYSQFANEKKKIIHIWSMDSYIEYIAIYGDAPSSPHGSYLYDSGAMRAGWQHHDEHTDHHDQENDSDRENCSVRQMHQFVVNSKMVKGIRKLLIDENQQFMILSCSSLLTLPRLSLISVRWQHVAASPLAEEVAAGYSRRGPPSIL
jgi:hypothetical protein